MLRQCLILLGFIAIAFCAAAIGVGFTDTGRSGWYQALQRPAATPPDWAFPLAWNTLYTLMGVAGYLLWRARRFGGAPVAWGFYFTQLALNASWSLIFFGGQSIAGGLVIIVLLDIAVVGTVIAFWFHRPLAGALLLPYPAWLGLATFLNYRLLVLNA
jgi:tryptophan-rich sensory protein